MASGDFGYRFKRYVPFSWQLISLCRGDNPDLPSPPFATADLDRPRGKHQASRPTKTAASKLFLGIRHAQGQFVQLANPRVTKSSRRRWTGLVVALSVTFTVCDAQQVGFSPSYRFLSITQDLAFFQMKRTDQKSPQAMEPWRVINQLSSNRALAVGGSRHFESLKPCRYALLIPTSETTPFCLRLNSCESPRAPPPMDPPTFC